MFGGSNGAPQSGMESMLRSMGLGTVLDAAKHLAENGAVLKIIAFADSAEKLNEQLGRIEANQIRIAAKLGVELEAQAGDLLGGQLLIEGSAIRRAEVEPGSSSRTGSAG